MLFSEPLKIIELDGDVVYHPNFIDSKKAFQYLHELCQDLNWKHDMLKIFGKTIQTERRFHWQGDKPYDYAYSGNSRISESWHPIVEKINQEIEERMGLSFNCCLLNYYENGSQGMSWHSDDEKVMEKNGAIASISLGASRWFHFKHKNKDIKPKVMLDNGSLLIMQGETQQHYLHQLPKSKKVSDARINLTFRRFVEGI